MSNAKLTCARLGAAIEAAETAGVYRDGPTMHTLNAVCDALTGHATRDSEPVRVPDGDLPVTPDQVAAAIAEVSDGEIDLARRHVATLKAAHALLLAETKRRAAKKAAEGGQFVTREEFSAFALAVASALVDMEGASRRVGYPDGDLRHRLRDRLQSASNGCAAALGELLDLLDGVVERDAVRSRKRAEARTQAVSGVSGRNW